MCPYVFFSSFFFFNDTATTEIYTLSLHDALPIGAFPRSYDVVMPAFRGLLTELDATQLHAFRSEEHTSELQSRENLVCRLLLEKKKKNKNIINCSKKNKIKNTTQI